MNQPLLKDILFEKVENNFTFKQDLLEALTEYQSTAITDYETDENDVLNTETIDESNCILAEDYDQTIDCILKVITEFINQNYTSKTNEANPQLQKTTIRF